MSPWEFTKWWLWIELHDPDWYTTKQRRPLTTWTEAGKRYQEEKRQVPEHHRKNFRRAKAGIEFQVRENMTEDNHLTFPDISATKAIRHRWILVRNTRPVVPAPSHTPLLQKHMSETQRCRILSIYLRPWTLVAEQASLHVPHLLDLDVVLSPALAQLPKRHRVKKPRQDTTETSMVDARKDYTPSHVVELEKSPALAHSRRRTVKKPYQVTTERSMVDAWNDYTRSHIVSKHAHRLIRNFTLTQMPNSVEADEDDEAPKGRTKLCEISTPWATPDSIANMLRGNVATIADVDSKYERTAASTRSTTQKLWGLDEDAAPMQEFAKDGDVGVYAKKDSSSKGLPNQGNPKSRAPFSAYARLHYEGLTKDKAYTWLSELCRLGSPKDTRKPPRKPSKEQKVVLDRIIERCLQEVEDEARDEVPRSEPLRCLLHGVPGAGKSEVLWWLRLFFEDVCGWTHGVNFVYLASQNSMAAIVDGCTFHEGRRCDSEFQKEKTKPARHERLLFAIRTTPVDLRGRMQHTGMRSFSCRRGSSAQSCWRCPHLGHAQKQ